MAMAAASLAVTGYACALAVIGGVQAIRVATSGHRPSSGSGVVSGISSYIGSREFASALASASASAGRGAAGSTTGSTASPAAGGAASTSAGKTGTSTPPGQATGTTPASPRAAHGNHDCLPAAAACSDLTQRLPWPQDDGNGNAGNGPVPPQSANG
jgi:hypothetical protein